MFRRFTHNDPRNRLAPANAQLSILHIFEVSVENQSDEDTLFAFLSNHRDIWLDEGLAPRGATGTTPALTRNGPRLLFFTIKTPRNDLAMLFKLTFGGAA